MWADTLYLAERAHLMRLIGWGAASVVAGTVVLLFLAARRSRSPLLLHFAIQLAAWGAIDVVLALVGWRGLAFRDLDGFTDLDRFLWLNMGLNVGYVAVGVTLAACGWALQRSLALLGAGVGVIVQGLALFVLDGYLLLLIARIIANP